MNETKLLQRLLNNRHNVRFIDFVSLINAFGFYLTRTEGSHSIFKNNEIAEFINIQNVKGEVKPYQIKQFLALIEKYDLKMEE